MAARESKSILPPTLNTPLPTGPASGAFPGLAQTAYPAWTTSAILLAAVPATVTSPLGFPRLPLLPLFAAIFGGAGYMTQVGDPINGSGTATAWSLTYLFLFGKRALVAKRPGPIGLAGVVGAQAALYGSYYWSHHDE